MKCPECGKTLYLGKKMFAPYCEIDYTDNYSAPIKVTAYMSGQCPQCEKYYQWELEHEFTFKGAEPLNFCEMIFD